MPHYLIYQDSSIDEGSRTIIVGPFATHQDREVVRRGHQLNVGGGWAVGGYDWECAGQIDGEVSGFRVDSALELLNHHPRTPETIAQVQDRAQLLAGLGFETPDWVRELRPPPEPGRWAVDGKAALQVWAKEHQRDLMRASFFAPPGEDAR